MQPRTMKETEKPQLSQYENIAPSQHPRLPTMQQYEADNNNIKHTCSKQPSADHHMQKSGLITIQVNNQKKISTRAKVYSNRLDHYILLSSKSITNPKQKYVNLKHTNVELEGTNCIRVTPSKDVDGQSLLIIISNEKEVSAWMEALTPSDVTSPTLSHRLPLMPTLQESDEE